MEVVYTWDGKDFKDYGVRVSSSQGLIGGLKPKSGLEVQWSDEHGSVTDRSQMYFEGRTIVLNCFLADDGAEDFIDRIGAFTALFYLPGEHVLRVAVGERALEYRVSLSDAITVEKTFRDRKMVATFSLRLYEAQPEIPQLAGQNRA